jgi:hypothetical protein
LTPTCSRSKGNSESRSRASALTSPRSARGTGGPQFRGPRPRLPQTHHLSLCRPRHPRPHSHPGAGRNSTESAKPKSADSKASYTPATVKSHLSKHRSAVKPDHFAPVRLLDILHAAKPDQQLVFQLNEHRLLPPGITLRTFVPSSFRDFSHLRKPSVKWTRESNSRYSRRSCRW